MKNIQRQKITAKRLVVYFATLTFSIALLFVGRTLATRHPLLREDAQQETYRARVLTVQQLPTDSRFKTDAIHNDMLRDESISFTARITSGQRAGEVVQGVQQMESYYSQNRKYVEPNDKILIMRFSDMTDTQEWLWVEYLRTDALMLFGGLFCAALILFGLMKGLNTLIALVFTCVSIFYVFVPAMLNGENPYLWSIAICLYITLSTLLLVNGASRKSFVAGFGCFSGTLAASLLSVLMDRLMHLTGVLNDESIYLMMLETERPIDLKGVVFAGVIIGAVGAIMDVSMSVTSPLFELYERTGGRLSGVEMVKSGMRIGRDFMSTMANTLVLAYIGCDLSLVMLLMAYNTSLLEMMNREMLVTEILQAITGSFGILLTIPLASIVCALVLCGPFSAKGKSDARPLRIEGLAHYERERPARGTRLDSRPQEHGR